MYDLAFVGLLLLSISPWVMAIKAVDCVESGIFSIRIRQAGHSRRACSKRPRPLGGPIVGH